MKNPAVLQEFAEVSSIGGALSDLPHPLGGSSHLVNRGDRESPNWGTRGTPSKWRNSMAYKWGWS